MRKRNAFIEAYKKTKPFEEDLSEFDEAREVVMGLIGEYEEAETPGYLGGGEADEDKAMGDRR